MQKNKEKSTENKERHTADFSLYDKSGRQKTYALSIVAAIIGILSVVFSFLGAVSFVFAIVGIVFGIASIILSVVERVKLGYFNAFIIIGIIAGIFATVVGIFFCLYSAFLPDILKWIEGTGGADKVESV